MYCQSQTPGVPPREFEGFNFFIATAPDHAFKIYNIPASTMMKAGMESGYEWIDYRKMYANPDFADHPVIQRYLVECNGPDYIMRMKVKRN